MPSSPTNTSQPAIECGKSVFDNKLTDELRLSFRFLEIASQHSEMMALLNEFISEIQNVTGCEAIGIRILDEKGYIPYQSYIGFSKDFYAQESMLSIKCDQCMCIKVVKGNTDPNLPFYTRLGSFYTNKTTELLSTFSESEKEQTRNACNRFGYETVALIPMRIGEQILGLIHIADSRENMISLLLVKTFERVFQQVALAVQRIKAEEKSKENQKLFRLNFENANDGITLVDTKGNFIKVNNRMSDIFGYSVKEFESMNLDTFTHPEDKDISLNFIKKSLSGAIESSIFENRYLHKQGHVIWGQVSISIVKDEEGDPLYFVSHIQDITRRRHVKEALRKSRDELEVQVKERAGEVVALEKLHAQSIEIRDSLPDAMIYRLERTPDGRRKFTYASKGCRNLFQVEPQDIADDAGLLYNMIHPEYVETQQLEEERSIKHLDFYDCEIPAILPSGKISWHKWYAKPKKVDNGTLVWDGMCLDITPRKEAEEALRKAGADLEVQVQERTRNLFETNQKLKSKVEELKAAEIKLKKAYSEIKQLKNQLEADQIYLREEIKLNHNHDNIIGSSDKMKYVLFRVEQIAPMDTTALILGETGTGKELIARAIHNASNRKERPLIKVDCASLPVNLIESELFGHEKGAFTGADSKRVGRFELADGATIFLDEIGDLPLELQSKLLRVLQDGEFERLGSSHTRSSDVRVIAATNRNLEKDVENKKFRMDLFYRLSVFTITTPPLRERVDDIVLLVNHMVRKFEKKLGKQIKSIPTDILAKLQNYSWPGNVRELENVIQSAIINTEGDTLQLSGELAPSCPGDTLPTDLPIKSLEEAERGHILLALAKANWQIQGKAGAARLLDINSSTLRGRMRKLGIHRSSHQS